jgi:serine/threonine protein kinase
MEDIIIEKKIGQGSFGEIFLGTDTIAHKKVAIKILPKETSLPSHIKKETKAGSLLAHPNIAKYYEHHADIDNDYLIFEYVDGHDLFTKMEKRNYKPTSEMETKKIIAQVVNALVYAHEHGVVHMDIKLDSILTILP